jgi:hypothetical protein
VPATKFEIVVLVVLPAILPGLIVQLPEGNPLNTTFPVDDVQLVCVIVPTIGAERIAKGAAVPYPAKLVHPFTVAVTL